MMIWMVRKKNHCTVQYAIYWVTLMLKSLLFYGKLNSLQRWFCWHTYSKRAVEKNLPSVEGLIQRYQCLAKWVFSHACPTSFKSKQHCCSVACTILHYWLRFNASSFLASPFTCQRRCHRCPRVKQHLGDSHMTDVHSVLHRGTAARTLLWHPEAWSPEGSEAWKIQEGSIIHAL